MCDFKLAYSAKCKKEGDPFCEEHSKEKCCSCGKQATRQCSYAGQFLCGYPLCDNCKYVNDGTQSAWGFIGHKHIKKE